MNNNPTPAEIKAAYDQAHYHGIFGHTYFKVNGELWAAATKRGDTGADIDEACPVADWDDPLDADQVEEIEHALANNPSVDKPIEAGQEPHTPLPWYEANTGNDQGLIISEATGANVAVTYDKNDAAFIIRACNSHAELVAAGEALEQWAEHMGGWEARCWVQLRNALAAARQ